jgi:CHAT domain
VTEATSERLEAARSMGAGAAARHAMNKVKILFLAANPNDTEPLKLDIGIREIGDKIQASKYRDSLEVISEWAVSPDDLQQSLLKHKPHIVHFTGHGSPTAEIILQDQNGWSQPVSKEALAQLFHKLKDNVRIVVLNACSTRPQAEAIAQTIDCTIGMNQPIGGAAAIVFARSFYRAIGFGRSVQEAFDLARVALLLEGIPEDNTPEMHVRSGVDPSKMVLITPTDRPDDTNATAAGLAPDFVPFKQLTQQVKTATSLVELVWSIGKAVVPAGYAEHQAEQACSHYVERYEHRYAQVKVLGMAEPVPLASIYTEVRTVTPTLLRGYRTQEELQELFLQEGRDSAGFAFHRNTPKPGLEVANDEKHRFLNVLGAPGAGKSTFLRHIGLMALMSFESQNR